MKPSVPVDADPGKQRKEEEQPDLYGLPNASRESTLPVTFPLSTSADAVRQDQQKDDLSPVLESATLDSSVSFANTGLEPVGIQAKSGIDPKPQANFGGFEMCMSDVTKNEVDSLYEEWKSIGVIFDMEPTDLEFGYTFVAVDLDGHRLRVCATDTTNIRECE